MVLPRFRPTLAAALRSPTTAVVAALALRSVALWLSNEHADFQRHHYHSQGLEALVLAHSLVTGHGFSFPYPQYIPTAWVAPVYVWILSIGVLLSPTEGRNVVLFGQILNLIFSALTCYPIYLLGEGISSKKIGLAAAWVWVFLPVAILMPIEYTWDQSLAALQLCVLLCSTYWLRGSSSGAYWSGYGLLWGITALTNPTICLLLPCLALWLWIQRSKAGIPATQLLARSLLVFVLSLLPWTMRNWVELGGFSFVKSNFGVELWLGNNPEVKEIISATRHPFVNAGELDQLVSSGELNYNHSKEREALSFIRSQPLTFTRLCFNRFVDTWTAAYDSKTDLFIWPLGVQRIYVWFSALFSAAAFLGLVWAMRNDALEWLPLTLCVLLFPIPYYLTHTMQRYRHPIDPVLTLLAVIGTARIYAFIVAQKASAVSAESENQNQVLV